MKPVSLCVYRDTIEEHDCDWNLSEIDVPEEIARQFFEECLKDTNCEWKTYEEFITNYTADDTEQLYDYAVKHDAVLSIVHWEGDFDLEEICPYCGNINKVKWHGKSRRIHCDECGKEILLCSLCDCDNCNCSECPY